MRELEAKDGGQVAEQTTILGISREAWHQHIDRLFSIARNGEDIPEAALLHAWQGVPTSEDVAWAHKEIASLSAPVDWEQRVKAKFPDAICYGDKVWSTTQMPCKILGYSWQHAAHHPDVIGEGQMMCKRSEHLSIDDCLAHRCMKHRAVAPMEHETECGVCMVQALGGGRMNTNRRADILKMTTSELAIRNAVLEVEKLGCDARLTDIVVALSEQQSKLADWCEATGNIPPDTPKEAGGQDGR